MGRAERQARREHRKARRDKIKTIKSKLKGIAEDLVLPDAEDVDAYAAKFREWWPTLCACLELVKEIKLTGERADNKLQKLINTGEAAYKDPELGRDFKEFLDELRATWKAIRSVLHVAMFLTGDKTDEVLEKVIEYGDGLTAYVGDDVLELS